MNAGEGRVGRWARVPTIGAFLVLLAAGAAASASAQTAVPSDLTGIVEIDGIMDADGITLRVKAHNDTDEELSDIRVELAAHARTRSRFGLSSAIDEGRVGPVLGRTTTPAATLRPGADITLRAHARADALGLNVAPPGVYPLTVDLVAEEELLDRTVTAIVVPPPTAQPVRFAVVLDVRGPVALRVDGLDESAVGQIADRVRTVARAVGDDLPATLMVDGRAIDELGAAPTPEATAPGDETPLEALRMVAGRPNVEIVPYPYGPADLVALLRDGHEDLARRLVERGGAAIGDLEGRDDASPIVAVPARLDETTARWLSERAEATVLSESALGLPLRRDLPATPPSVRRVVGASELRVVVPDPLVAEVIDRTARQAGPVLTAQRIVAETAAVFFERPGSETPRGFVLTPPAHLAGTLLPELAAALADASWLAPTTLSGLLDDVPTGETPETLAYPIRERAAELPSDYLTRVVDARAHVQPLRGLLDEDAVAGLGRQLDTITAVGFREPALRAVGEAVASGPRDAIAEIRAALSVVEPPELTLTGTKGTVPVTFANAGDRDVLVGIRLLTTRYEVDVVDEPLPLPAGTEVTSTFDVRALAPGGRYPIAIEVTDPGGETVLATGQVLVRSTASNIAGLLVTGGAALVLVAWTLGGLMRRRRQPSEGAAA